MKALLHLAVFLLASLQSIVQAQQTAHGAWQVAHGAWQVYLKDARFDFVAPFCGGSIVSEWFVVTSASCVVNMPIGQYVVGIGKYKADADKTTTFQVKSVHIHIEYNPESADYDIALLKLAKPFEWKEEVGAIGTIHLPPNNDLITYSNKNCILSGPALMVDGAVMEKKTLERVMSFEKCRREVPSFVSVTSNILCTSSSKETCGSLSGNALAYRDGGNHYVLVGIKHSCHSEKYPTIYTKVSPHLGSWMHKTSGGNVKYPSKPI